MWSLKPVGQSCSEAVQLGSIRARVCLRENPLLTDMNYLQSQLHFVYSLHVRWLRWRSQGVTRQQFVYVSRVGTPDSYQPGCGGRCPSPPREKPPRCFQLAWSPGE